MSPTKELIIATDLTTLFEDEKRIKEEFEETTKKYVDILAPIVFRCGQEIENFGGSVVFFEGFALDTVSKKTCVHPLFSYELKNNEQNLEEDEREWVIAAGEGLSKLYFCRQTLSPGGDLTLSVDWSPSLKIDYERSYDLDKFYNLDSENNSGHLLSLLSGTSLDFEEPIFKASYYKTIMEAFENYDKSQVIAILNGIIDGLNNAGASAEVSKSSLDS
jgi:hypothetical protein